MDDLRLLQELTAAWNDRDADRVVAFAAPEIVVDLPRGREVGARALLGAMDLQSYGVGIFFRPRRVFGADGRYVLAGRLEYRYVESGEVANVQEDGGVVFEMSGGLVTRFAPKQSLGDALADLGLEEDSPSVELGDGPAG